MFKIIKDLTSCTLTFECFEVCGFDVDLAAVCVSVLTQESSTLQYINNYINAIK